MVLRLKAWESSSPPNLVKSITLKTIKIFASVAGWSSPVARQAHNLKVVGSNPTPATKIPQFDVCPESGHRIGAVPVDKRADLGTLVYVLVAQDIVFSQIGACLHLDQLQRNFT